MDLAGESQHSAPHARVITLMVAVALGYYLGGLLGLQLRLPPATPSVLWPPNAVLTAVLISAPVRWWGWCLLAALPAHLAAQWQTGWSPSLVAAFFVTNCTEALIGAIGVRLISDAPHRLDTLRRLAAFLLMVVVMAPLLSTFADAAVASWLHDDVDQTPYWLIWRNRLTANVLAQLTVTPAMVGLLTGTAASFMRTTGRRLEALALAIGLLAAGSSTFRASFETPIITAIAAEAPLILQLPFVLWAAVRFGAAGTSLSLLVTTTLMSWAVVHGHGPFRELQPATTIVALQLSLIMAATTLLTLAAVIEERRQAEQALAGRLQFEALLSQLSTAFVQLPSDRMTVAFEEWLGRLGASLRVDCVRLFTLSDAGDLDVLCAWTAPTFPVSPALVVRRDVPWTYRQIVHCQQPVAVGGRDDVPAEALVDQQSLERHGYQAALVIPLVAAGRVLGAMAFGSPLPRAWPADVVTHLRLISDVFANALVRKQTEDALRASEMMKSVILESLTSGVAVIDRAGRVGAVNDNWTRLMRESEGPSYPAVHVGDNLLESFAAAADQGNMRLRDAVTGVTAVLEGVRDRFVFEHVDGVEQTRWWVMVVARLRTSGDGAVVTYSEISERRRAEFEAQRSRHELAHVTRLSTMGALAVSLAHQLNQPLTGILSNAQAGLRLLNMSSPDLEEIRAILTDVVDDDRRASAVIQRLRELLRKSDMAQARVDLCGVVRDVTTLVHSDAVIRNVALAVDVDPSPLVVQGDRVQLQQVVLNLLVNALEAMGDAPTPERTIRIRCRRHNGTAAVAVHDTGPGFERGAEDRLFEPFYTTKPGGMGMGLSIARAIIEALGGVIRVRRRNVDETGAIVEFTLPLAQTGGQRA